MAASFPAAIKSFVDRTDDVHDVMAADVNDVYAEVTAIETELGADPAGTAANLVTRLARSLSGSGNLDFASATTLTITSGAITPTQNWHLVDTQSAAATDDIDTITATNATDGFVLFLRQVHDDRDVTLKHDSGNIKCPGGADVVLTDATQIISLVYDGTTSKWMVVSGSQGLVAGTGIDLTGSGGGTVTVSLTSGGWIPANETWTHISSASPSYTFGTGVDVSGTYSPGMRVKYTDSGTQYGLMTVVSGSQVTIYSGTDYSMSGSAITNPYYSMVKAPQGFPLDPTKWTSEYTWADVSLPTPTSGSTYLAGAEKTVPVGAWSVSFSAFPGSETSGSGSAAYYIYATGTSDTTTFIGAGVNSLAASKEVGINTVVVFPATTTAANPIYLTFYAEGDFADIDIWSPKVKLTSGYL